MKGLIVGIFVVIGVGWLGLKVGTIYHSKIQLDERVRHYLNFVDGTSIPKIKQDLVQDAKKYGIELEPEQINIEYEDTDVLSYAQRAVGRKIAEFENKRVTINLNYKVTILGFSFQQDIGHTKLQKIKIQRKAPQEYFDLLK